MQINEIYFRPNITLKLDKTTIFHEESSQSRHVNTELTESWNIYSSINDLADKYNGCS